MSRCSHNRHHDHRQGAEDGSDVAYYDKCNCARYEFGEPLEDAYEAVNSVGVQIIVERLEKREMSCFKEGIRIIVMQTWRDWNAVSYSGNEKDAPRKG